jgi:hypothetical protein
MLYRCTFPSSHIPSIPNPNHTDNTPLEVLSAGITAIGGSWHTGLTRNIMHLFALGPHSRKYETVVHFQASTHLKLLHPHWLDDAIKLGVRVGAADGGV